MGRTKVESTMNPKSNRIYKARIFEMIFSDKKELLALYNAVNKTHYDDPELLEINTLKNAIYMSMHNDVSFIIDSRLSLYEHQSTYSPNLLLRYLMYVSDIYAGITKDENLYGTKAISIPLPRFLIFYNGKDSYPEQKMLKLSDLYSVKEENPWLELTAVMLNINPGYNEELMNACKTLHDYSEYTARVRMYAEQMELEDAVERAIAECIKEDILAGFLSKNRAEAKRMSIYEYDEEKHMRQTREEGYEEGTTDGMTLSLIHLVKIKWMKGKSLERISDEVEESIDGIRYIYEMIVQNPEESEEEILKKLNSETGRYL